MHPIRNQVRPGPGRRCGADRGRRLSRWYPLAGLSLTFALFCGLTVVANAAINYLPPAPTGLTADAASSSEVGLTWDAPTAPRGLTLTGYDVYQATSSGGEPTTPVNSVLVATTSYTVPDLDSGTTYYFDVTAVYQNSDSLDIASLPSNEATMPAAPSGLTADAAGSSAVDLSWDAPAAPPGLTLTGYDVYQGTSPGGESTTPDNSTLVTTTSSTVPDLDSATTYYFDVTAVYQNSDGRDLPSFSSNEAPATTNPAGSHTSPPPGTPAPGGLAAEAASSSAVHLSWDAPTAPPGLTLTGYDVYQGTSPGGESTTPDNSTLITTTSYTVPDLDSATTYYFDVTAIYRSGQSPPSREASATTDKPSTALKAQVVYFAPLASHAVGVSFTVSASASSGLAVSFGSDTPRVCFVTGSTVRTLVAGRCEIQASQGGDAGFQPAAGVIRGFTVNAVGASSPTPKPTALSTGPGTLVPILLVVAILLMVGTLALLAARLRATRHQLHSRPPTPQAARIQTEPQLGPPAAVHIRVTGTDATHAVRIEPRPGTRRTTIEEVQS